MSHYASRAAGGLAFLLLLANATRAEYVFTRIAEIHPLLPGPFENSFGGLAINNSGQVAFLANTPNFSAGIFTGSGGATTTVVELSEPLGAQFSTLGTYPDIKDDGTTAFFASLDSGVVGLFTGSGGPIATVMDTSGPVASFGSFPVDNAAINNAGAAAFRGGLDTGVSGIIIQKGGATITVADTAGPFDSFNVPTDSSPAINNSNRAAFFARLDTGARGVFSGSGGGVTTIATDSGPFSSFHGNADINDAGTVAFFAILDAGGSGIFTGSGGATATVADGSGPFKAFGNTPAINNSGAVAFVATLDTDQVGIFTGPDPVADKVIQSGDTLDGSTVPAFPSLFFSREGFNDAGEIVFWVQLADNRTGIYRASPAVSNSADYDMDGDVDGNDFLVWQRGGSPNPLSPGDLAAWKAQFGNVAVNARSAPVPELTAAALAEVGLLGTFLARELTRQAKRVSNRRHFEIRPGDARACWIC
jgi:hypothetical protein